jgi:hypothetical protein
MRVVFAALTTIAVTVIAPAAFAKGDTVRITITEGIFALQSNSPIQPSCGSTTSGPEKGPVPGNLTA